MVQICVVRTDRLIQSGTGQFGGWFNLFGPQSGWTVHKRIQLWFNHPIFYFYLLFSQNLIFYLFIYLFISPCEAFVFLILFTLLVQDESQDLYKRQQLRELAMLNSNFREESPQLSGSVSPFTSNEIKRPKTEE